MDERSRIALEFAGIIDVLRDAALTPVGKEGAGNLSPLEHLAEVREALAEAGEAKGLLDRGEEPPLTGVADIRLSLDRAKIEGAALEARALWQIYATLSAAERLRAFFRRTKGAAPLLWRRASRLNPPQALCSAIAEAITPDGEVADAASPALHAVRRAIRTLREAILAKLDRFLTSPTYQSALSEPLVTVRNGRYVIPVKAKARGTIRGVVQDQSGSGLTLYVEPGPVVEMNNRLRVLQGREEREVRNVLRLLAAQVGQEAESLRELLACLGELDLILAKGRMAISLGANVPHVTDHRRLILRQARHPFLVLGRCREAAGIEEEGSTVRSGGRSLPVPIDLDVGGTSTVLIISGPNTGGKTVALKTAGLLTLMALSGLPIPASPDSQVPCYRAVFADIGDKQSIAESLSTFSSHMSQIVKILAHAGPAALVLLDELGAGTDPAEGAALGIAILECLRARGASVVATTHLEGIKAFATATAGVENASVEFNPEDLTPRYVVRQGLPGQSYGLEIAGRLGLPPEILGRARAILPEVHREVQEMLEALGAERRRVEELRAQLQEELRRANALTKDAGDLLGRLGEEAENLKRRMREEAKRFLAELRHRGEDLIRGLRDRAAPPETTGAFRRGLELLQREVEAVAAPPVAAGASLADIGPGQRVRVAGLGQEGRILGPVSPQGTVEVELTVGRAHLPVAVLRPVSTLGPPRSEVPVFVEVSESVSAEINLIGCTVEESTRRLETYLDAAFVRGLRQVRVIHGKGTGALRKGVHQFLATHPLVESFRLAELSEGGGGATVAALKER
jgi:DNA mismatch repair protein MutS2